MSSPGRPARRHLGLHSRAWGRFGATPHPRIAGLAADHSGEKLSQREVLERLGLAGDEFAERIFARCGVRERTLNLGPDVLHDTLQGRSTGVEEDLFRRTTALIDGLAGDPQPTGTVVSSSLYSLGCPTLAHRLHDHYGMDPATDKYHVSGVGCASAVPLLRLGAQALRHHPGKPVLVAAAENMGSILMPAQPDDPRAKTVGSAIFGDGCAVAMLSADPAAEGPEIIATQVHQLPGTLGAVSLTLTTEDSYLHLARELPDLAAAGLQDLVREFLRHQRLDLGAIEHWIVHPGGRRIIETVRDSLALDDEQVQTSWRTLAAHGNVGTPSIFYVLEETIAEQQPRHGERGLALTIGPGVTVGLMLLRW